MSPVRAPVNLPGLVKTAFAKAKASGDLTYYPTQVALLDVNSIHFQLRFSPSLASKPKGPPPKDTEADAKRHFNPFENPLPSMTIAQLPPSHALVLNKFAIVPEHFILITKTPKPQTHVLERDDVAAAHACVRAYWEEGQELFVFFNSGEHSGASQPHRHLQLLPVEQMRHGLDEQINGDGSQWNVLVESARGQQQRGNLPFTVLSETISPDIGPIELHEKYVSLYQRAAELVLPNQEVAGEGEARFSYNMAMTSNVIALCPRLAEGAAIKNQDGGEIGHIALNGTLLAGTALVKTQEQYDVLRGNPNLLFGILKQIGVLPKKVVSGSL
ncbi:5',5'''-P-1,P-4-tetraphosphate phosphorylase 2 [Truncatella angustata]|uniref:5',5'''-P-1,P-4-tetraphosphate phosphorylase 2 n=1 Tax=Truncatella angustata TaxID=152316 RepID=A0A9P8ZXW5_9PEZI|nr:5',5'''-P-1,P-4-tetraphosphate phosphorylase 2 [Truncatella angustata]KAH6654543.1 5',5'''-P-1,P-4-tetraphosphate phosphorylase 2 [Truncatella angustata]